MVHSKVYDLQPSTSCLRDQFSLFTQSTARLVIVALAIVIGLPETGTPQESVQPPALPPPVTGTMELSRDLSPWGMFATADSLVKAVLIGLVIASIVTWTVWLAKTTELVVARRQARRALVTLASVGNLAEAVQKVGASNSAAGAFVDAAKTELQLCENPMSREGVKERIASRLERIEANHRVLPMAALEVWLLAGENLLEIPAGVPVQVLHVGGVQGVLLAL